MTLAKSTTGPRMSAAVPCTHGIDQTPRNSVEASAANENAVPNSPRKKTSNGETVAYLVNQEDKQANARVRDHVARDELRLRDRHVERRLGELGLRRDHEQ